MKVASVSASVLAGSILLFITFLSISWLRLDAARVNVGPASISVRQEQHQKLKILIGVLTMASKFERRSIMRMAYALQMRPSGSDVKVRFVLAKPESQTERRLVAVEQLHHGDLMLLDCKENLNHGKTFTYFDTLARSGEKFDYVMKTDDDSYIRLTNLVQSLVDLSRTDLYYGYILPCENMDPKVGYMAGMGYLISWDLVEWIHQSSIPANNTDGTEDLLVGYWFDVSGRAKFRVNKKPMFYDYPDFGGGCAHELTPDTILVHQVKTTERWLHVMSYFQAKVVA